VATDADADVERRDHAVVPAERVVVEVQRAVHDEERVTDVVPAPCVQHPLHACSRQVDDRGHDPVPPAQRWCGVRRDVGDRREVHIGIASVHGRRARRSREQLDRAVVEG
jgi:hypothetical protein